MKVWPDADGTLVRRYLRTLGLRNSDSPRCVLNNFQRFVAGRVDDKPLRVSTVESWVRERASEWSLRTLVTGARSVNRFLNWLVADNVLADKPWFDLCQQYGQRTAPVVRAILRPDTAQALEALRPLPPFGSHLGQAMLQHVKRMRSLGFRYEREASRLLAFDRYLQQRTGASAQPLPWLIREYADLASTPEARLERLQSGRTLAQGLQRLDPAITPPILDKMVIREALRHRRRPYIYTEEQVRCLLAVALDMPSPRAPLRPLTLYTMLILGYCAGLRVGEFTRLALADFRPDDGTIEIRNTKFFKSRRLPLTASVVADLERYVAARQQAGASQEPAAALFWNEQGGRGYTVVTAQHLLTEVIRRAGLKPAAGRVGPRVHDLRHAFVVGRMLSWYREGVDAQPRLPYLATYLGHKDIYSTLVYLTITQELLQQASERFRVVGARVLKATEGGVSCA